MDRSDGKRDKKLAAHAINRDWAASGLKWDDKQVRSRPSDGVDSRLGVGKVDGAMLPILGDPLVMKQ